MLKFAYTFCCLALSTSIPWRPSMWFCKWVGGLPDPGPEQVQAGVPALKGVPTGGGVLVGVQ